MGDYSISSSPPGLSEAEAKDYYAGLPSRPQLVARTSTTPYEEPRGPEAHTKLKELRVVGNHKINKVGDDLAHKVLNILKENKVEWTSTDIVRFGYEGKRSGNVVLWIRVKPGSLSYQDGIDVAFKCKRVLVDFDLKDVDVEIRESIIVY
jgi:hypothetical protein